MPTSNQSDFDSRLDPPSDDFVNCTLCGCKLDITDAVVTDDDVLCPDCADEIEQELQDEEEDEDDDSPDA